MVGVGLGRAGASPGGPWFGRRPIGAGHPQHVAHLGVRHPGGQEEQVGEPVQVGDRQRIQAALDVQPVLLGGPPGGPFGTADDGTQHTYIIRYADMLLLKAEAKVNLGAYADAEALINQVRNRVSLPNVTTITSKEDGMNKVLKERLLELAFEGHRWFDLKRTGKALEIIKARTNGQGSQLSYVNNLTEQRLLWPIPQSQMDNNPNLTQNAGY